MPLHLIEKIPFVPLCATPLPLMLAFSCHSCHYPAGHHGIPPASISFTPFISLNCVPLDMATFCATQPATAILSLRFGSSSSHCCQQNHWNNSQVCLKQIPPNRPNNQQFKTVLPIYTFQMLGRLVNQAVCNPEFLQSIFIFCFKLPISRPHCQKGSLIKLMKRALQFLTQIEHSLLRMT